MHAPCLPAPLHHLDAEMARLRLLLHREILRLRARYHLSLDEFRGLYVSDEQVDALIVHSVFDPDDDAAAALTTRAASLRAATAGQFRDLPWHRVVATFALSETDQDLLLIALAPEYDVTFETVYAYVNNDVSRRLPTVDLALRLLASDSATRTMVRERLSPGSPLIDAGLLSLTGSEGSGSSLTRGLAIAPAVVDVLLGQTPHDPLLARMPPSPPESAWASLLLDRATLEGLQRVPALLASDDGPVVILEGFPGSGRADAARAVMASLGEAPLYAVEPNALPPDARPAEIRGRLSLLRRLDHRGVYVPAALSKQAMETDGSSLARELIAALSATPGPLFIAVEPRDRWADLLGQRRTVLIDLQMRDGDLRETAWRRALNGAGATASSGAVRALADRFTMTPGQMRHVINAALDSRFIATGDGGSLHDEALFAAARAGLDRPLARLAVKVRTDRFTWDDLVLPPSTTRQVRAVGAAVRGRRTVYETWGLQNRVASGLGVKALFAGGPGTGKTMSAAVVARDLGLDLYKIDLSAVVSKYIGETEKNLDRIFAAARGSNAILFFDEADALFGKRSQVTDAHDRYANIEVAYLLQALEEHDGVVVLASNARKHIDEAFARRLHYIVEYPLPDETLRERLWRGIYPAATPLGDDVDLRFLARQFAISGGDIRNVALDAAFLAAADGHVITMRHLVEAMARQSVKEGRIPSAADFRQYHPWVSPEV